MTTVSSLIICNAMCNARMRSRDSRMRTAILGCDATMRCAMLRCDERCYDSNRDARMRSAMLHRILASHPRIATLHPRIAEAPKREFAFDRYHEHCACTLKITCHGILRFSKRKSPTKKSRFGDYRMRRRDSRMRSAILGCDARKRCNIALRILASRFAS